MMGRRKARAILGAAVVSLLVGGVCFGRYSGGTGEPNDPYRIGTAADLTDIANHVEDYNKCFVMVNDISLAGHAWGATNIIGSSANRFTGVFDGKGHIVSNLIIDAPTVDYVGLFGFLRWGGEVKNLGLEDVNIRGDEYIGGLCGINYGTISECYSAGSVSGNYKVGGLCGSNNDTISQCYSAGSVNGDLNAGGLCGENDWGTVSNCYSTSSVTGKWDFVGGLCGRNYKAAIENCYSTGSISGRYDVGGLCGQNDEGTITYCYSTGIVNGTGTHVVGGLCGDGPPDGVRNSFWDIETSAIDETSGGGMGLSTAQMQSLNTYSLNGWSGEIWTIDNGNDYPHLAWENAGGVYIPEPTFLLPGSGTEGDPYRIDSVDDLVEVSVGSYYWDKHLVLEDDLDLGGVHLVRIGYTSSECFSGVFDGNDHVVSNLTIGGPTVARVGLFGYLASGSVVKNLGLGEVDIRGEYHVGGLCGINYGTISECYSTGSVSGDKYVGGLCGSNYGTISQCYSTGSMSGAKYVGGLCGLNIDGTIDGCYSTGSVSGVEYVGGLCGFNHDGMIRNCNSTGSVIGSYSEVGGLCGENDRGTIRDCYYSGSVTGTGDHMGGLCGTNVGTIRECYSMGSVSGDSTVGGLCGYNGRYNESGTIRDCYSTVSVSGNYGVGGLCGSNVSTISKCYSTGTVSGGLGVGGLCSSGGASNSFWDIETSGITSSSAGVGLTTQMMQSMRTYGLSGWAGQTWTIDDGNDYPHLAWENAGGAYISEPTVSLEGSGTEADPYRISSVDDLIEMSQGSYFWDKHYLLEYDLDLQDVNLTCIGLDNHHGFSGVFDGNSHVIRNLTVEIEDSDYVGFFAYIGPGGKVKNLGVEDVNISGRLYVGGLCGRNDGGTISDCYSTGSVSGAKWSGGLCGNNYNGTISDCYSTGSVSGDSYVGGLCGVNVNGGTISTCYSTSGVTGTGDDVGGLCGVNGGTISNSYSTGMISGAASYVGGLCGGGSGRLSNCYSTGTVSGGEYVGGLCGSHSADDPEAIISNCYSTGSVTGAWDYVGGLCGYNYKGTLTDCYSTGSVTGEWDVVGGLCGKNYKGTIETCRSTGNVSGREGVGGLCGSNMHGSINNSYSTGSVIGWSNAYWGNSWVGGLCGYNGMGTINACYNTGSVTGNKWYVGGLCGENSEGTLSNCYSTGVVSGDNFVGGLCGANDGDRVGAIISNCYSTGTVTGTGDYVGGLCGYNYNGTVSGSFWDVNSSGISGSDGGVGADTSLMQRMYLYSFSGWAGQTWTIDDGNDYPHLAWENAGGAYIAEPIVSLPGGGTEAEPYQITSLDDFVEFNLWTDYYRDKHSVLEDDLDVQGVSLLRIGYDPEYSFTGVFDGNGHVIRNLTMDLEDSDYVGLFGYIGDRGEVRNLGLEQVNIKGSNHVGALCGYNHDGTISNCYSTGSVSGASDVGGLCGENFRGTISDCYSASSVAGADGNVGGLCGYNERTIKECYSTGSVSGDSYVGGLCGHNDGIGMVLVCYSTGSVTGSGEYVGGLCGKGHRGVRISFWDIETSGMSGSAGGTGLPTVEMMDANTFLDAGWDFVDETANGTRDIWHINDGLGYPRLWWERCLVQIEVAMKLTPRTVNARSQGRWIKAHFKLPEGVLPEEVDVNRPAVLEPLGIESEYIDVFVNKEGLVEVLAAFDRSYFCCSEPIGDLVTVEGLSFAGQCFYGMDTIRVIDKRLELVGDLAMYWLADCEGPQWCDGSDINADGVVNLRDFALVERFCVEVIGE